MSQRIRWSIVAIGLGIALLHAGSARAQIVDLVPTPSPSCSGDPVMIQPVGDGVCADVVVRIEDSVGNIVPTPPQSGTLSTMTFVHTFDSPGTYALTVVSADCSVNIPGSPILHQVERCIVAGQHEATGLTEIQRRAAAAAHDFTITGAPNITKGFGGKLQPGNEASYLLGGEFFPTSDAEGDVWILLREFEDPTAIHWIQLEEVQWDPAGRAVAVRVPENITGVIDQQTIVRIVTQPDLATSNDWPVEFLAARETRTLTQDEVEVLECGDAADVDHCNDVSDIGVIHYFCGKDDNATYSGCHYNAAGVGDFGQDKYRIQLANGWVINTILFTQLSGSPVRTSPGAAGESSWVEVIAWGALSFETEMYSGVVSIIGPRGVPYQ